jgi:hypothetical protein
MSKGPVTGGQKSNRVIEAQEVQVLGARGQEVDQRWGKDPVQESLAAQLIMARGIGVISPLVQDPKLTVQHSLSNFLSLE